MWFNMSYNLPKSIVVESVSAIDGTAAAASTILTPGSRFYPISVTFELTSVSGFAVVASASVGTNSTSFNNILAITALTSVSTANNILTVPLSSVIASVAASTAIAVKVTTPATATTYVLKVSLLGYYE